MTSERAIGFGDSYGTRAVIEVDDEGELSVALGVGLFAEIKGFPTPEAARQIAGALLDAVDAADSAKAE